MVGRLVPVCSAGGRFVAVLWAASNTYEVTSLIQKYQKVLQRITGFFVAHVSEDIKALVILINVEINSRCRDQIGV